MRSQCLLIWTCLFVSGALRPATLDAQEATAPKVLTADDLKAPSTPAATILGTSPTTIERPDTPRALVFNLASSIADAKGVPQNYAVQAAPYWLRSHPGLLFDSYVRPTIGQSLARSFAVSIATADLTSGTAVDLGSRFAIGAGAVVKPGRVDPRLDAIVADITKKDQDLILLLHRRDTEPRLEGLEKIRKDLRARLTAETDPKALVEIWRTLQETESTIAAIALDLDQQIAKAQQAIVKLTRQIQQMNVQRSGASLSVAAAWSAQVPGDVFGQARAERAALWLTPSYKGRFPRKPSAGGAGEPAESPYFIDAIGVVRYLRDRLQGTNAWDLGGRLVCDMPDGMAVSGEVVRRWHSGASATANTFRAVAMFEARLADTAHLFASFGREFTQAERQRTLVSVVGINLGFGQKPVVSLQPPPAGRVR